MATTDTKTPAHASNVYLFKNGYGMIIKTFEFPSSKDNNGQSIELMDPPSNPIHGTFWIQSLSNKSSSFFHGNFHNIIYLFSFNQFYSYEKDE